MTIGVLLVTHEEIGRSLLSTATRIIGACSHVIDVLPVAMDCDCELQYIRASKMIAEMDDGSGVIVLTDMFGGTPSNMATKLSIIDNVRVIAGVNLPMVVRILNYAELGLDEVALKALQGGRDGIFICENE